MILFFSLYQTKNRVDEYFRFFIIKSNAAAATKND